jgi:hypothetical protein
MRVINRSPMVLMVVSKGVTVAVYPGQEIEIDMPHPHNQRLLQGGLIREVVRVSDVPVSVEKGKEVGSDGAGGWVSEKGVSVEVKEEAGEVKEEAVEVGVSEPRKRRRKRG